MKNSMRKRIFTGILALAMLLVPLCETLTPTAEAATKAATNKKAKKLYKKQINKIIAKGVTSIAYKFADVNGDGITDAMVEYHTGKNGSGRHFTIYSYKGGKLIKLLDEDEYGLEKVIVRKKGIVLYYCGHGHEEYSYYKKTSTGKFRLTASKGRMLEAKWIYWNRSGKEVSKTAFNKLVKTITSGSKKTYSISSWTWK
jgi:hypothetical protein